MIGSLLYKPKTRYIISHQDLLKEGTGLVQDAQCGKGRSVKVQGGGDLFLHPGPPLELQGSSFLSPWSPPEPSKKAIKLNTSPNPWQ
ncbi:uncharacterized protein QC761_0008360 [Podospora bellae-mahoneyi]|uniref:Uncharacterized protein n=1 Tax=Podospora bellae-mahoneyi TaxID=2093777 RepID=A0ABR0FXE7_9PEZI|nr:hypothetical protein QC761_0008360 [Podospora bellae-mahoneyi]